MNVLFGWHGLENLLRLFLSWRFSLYLLKTFIPFLSKGPPSAMVCCIW